MTKPKALHGIRKHRCLDTIHCECHSEACASRSFSGLNKKSLQLETDELLGAFNFHLTAGCVADEELHSHILNHSQDATAGICKKLMATDKWMDDAVFHCTAVRAKEVKARRSDMLLNDSRQRTLHAHSQDGTETPGQKKHRSIGFEMKRVDRETAAKTLALESDVEFTGIFKAKSNRNCIGLPFKGLKKVKKLKLIGENVTSAKELLKCSRWGRSRGFATMDGPGGEPL